MSKFMWILGATCLGVAGYVLLSDVAAGGRTAGVRYGSDGTNEMDELGASVGGWGTKSRVKGTGGVLGGKLEQGLGELTDDKAVKGKGVLDETVGQVKDAAGQAAHAVSSTIADLKN